MAGNAGKIIAIVVLLLLLTGVIVGVVFAMKSVNKGSSGGNGNSGGSSGSSGSSSSWKTQNNTRISAGSYDSNPYKLQKTRTNNATACQTLCDNTDGCTGYEWWPKAELCLLYNYPKVSFISKDEDQQELVSGIKTANYRDGSIKYTAGKRVSDVGYTSNPEALEESTDATNLAEDGCYSFCAQNPDCTSFELWPQVCMTYKYPTTEFYAGKSGMHSGIYTTNMS